MPVLVEKSRLDSGLGDGLVDIKPITSSKAGGLNRNRLKRFGLLGPVEQAEFV
jgi:hypothetical protein